MVLPVVIRYRRIFSFNRQQIQNLDLGQVYYNSGSNAFKVTQTVLGTGAWASGGNLIAATSGMASLGTQTAALSVGGYLGPPGATAKNEEYNGTSWTEKADINTARYGLRRWWHNNCRNSCSGPSSNNNLLKAGMVQVGLKQLKWLQEKKMVLLLVFQQHF